MKATLKHIFSKAGSFIYDLIIEASGLNETTDVKKLVKDFFMYSFLLLQHLRNFLLDAVSNIGLYIGKHKKQFVYTLLVTVGIALLSHSIMITVLILLAMIIVKNVLQKRKRHEDGFVNSSSL